MVTARPADDADLHADACRPTAAATIVVESSSDGPTRRRACVRRWPEGRGLARLSRGRHRTPPPKVSSPSRYLWERPSERRRRRSNRPRKLSGKRTAGGWVSGKWRAPHRRRPTDEVSAPSIGAESFRSPDRGGRERRSPCVGKRDSVETCLTEPTAGPLKRTPLHALHKELGARLVPFAGYEMPVQYPPASWPSMPTPAPPPACSTSRTWARCGSPPSPATTRPRRSRRWCRATSRACSPASSATRSSPTTTAASSTT